VLSFGSSGQLFTQITKDAPFQIMLSADDKRPQMRIENGLAVPESRFTYAIGKLVLWSRSPDFVKGEETVCTENLIRVDDVMESPKLAE
jgi:molybdate transport system substrate-binding protein